MLLSSAHVLRAGGWEDDAREALLAAIEVNERKGNVVTAGTARALLADLGSVPS
jgi:hypothetical protein